MENKYLYLTKAELINGITVLDTDCRALEKVTKDLIDFASENELSDVEYEEILNACDETNNVMWKAAIDVALMKAALRDKYGVFYI